MSPSSSFSSQRTCDLRVTASCVWHTWHLSPRILHRSGGPPAHPQPAAETSVDHLWVLQVKAPFSMSRQHWGVSAGVCPHDITWGAAFGWGGEEGEEVVAGQARSQAPTSKEYALPLSLQL